MSRLKKLNKNQNNRLSKTASASLTLESSILKSGDVIGISARVVNWKPWFQVFLEYDAGASSSFYDGPDMDRAFKMYSDVLLAFKGVGEAERFRKAKGKYEDQIGKLVQTRDTQYHNLILKSPKFLGFDYY